MRLRVDGLEAATTPGLDLNATLLHGESPQRIPPDIFPSTGTSATTPGGFILGLAQQLRRPSMRLENISEARRWC